jgi:hypothetical protein
MLLMNNRFMALGFATIACACALAEDLPAPAAPPANGALVFSDGFDRAELGSAWRVTTPTLSIVDGKLKADQTERHSAVGMVKVGHKNLVIEFKFKLGGSSGINAVCNDREYKEGHGGHLCRVSLQPRQIFLADDKERLRREIEEMKKDPAKKAEVAKLVAGRSIGFLTKLEPERWYHLSMEIKGEQLSVRLDGKPAGSLKSTGIAHPTKSDFYFAVSGKDALFDDLLIWSLPND